MGNPWAIVMCAEFERIQTEHLVQWGDVIGRLESYADRGELGARDRWRVRRERRRLARYAPSLHFRWHVDGCTVHTTGARDGRALPALYLYGDAADRWPFGVGLRVATIAEYLLVLDPRAREVARALVAHWELSLAELVQVASGITRPE